jgi:hypothetical protein
MNVEVIRKDLPALLGGMFYLLLVISAKAIKDIVDTMVS